MAKREGYLSWDDYFMSVALLSGKRSKDPSTQVGACIVNRNNIIESIGYNGLPKGCSDDEFPWEKEGEMLNTKYPFVVHAELSGCKIYVALFPCNECAKAIIQSGISEVVYLSYKYADTDSVKASKRMFKCAGVALNQLIPTHEKIELSLNIKDI